MDNTFPDIGVEESPARRSLRHYGPVERRSFRWRCILCYTLGCMMDLLGLRNLEKEKLIGVIEVGSAYTIHVLVSPFYFIILIFKGV